MIGEVSKYNIMLHVEKRTQSLNQLMDFRKVLSNTTQDLRQQRQNQICLYYSFKSFRSYTPTFRHFHLYLFTLLQRDKKMPDLKT